MFLGDILWALAKVGGGYLPGGLQDVLYVACYVPLGAPRASSCGGRTASFRAGRRARTRWCTGCPTRRCWSRFLVLVYFARAEVGGPVAVMTMVVFVLTLLVMVRQGTMLRDDARHARAAGDARWSRPATRRSSRTRRTSS